MWQLKYKIGITLLLILCGFSINANTQNINKDLAAFAKRANNGSEIIFTFSATNSKGKEIYKEAGIIKIYGNKYKLDIPDNLLILNNGVTRWIYKIEEEELVIAANNPQEEDILENPFIILRAGSSKIISNYTISVVKRVAEKEDSNIQGVPDKIILAAKDGSKYIIKITEFNNISNLSGAQFEFDVKKYPNAMVTDLR
ncbi:MAG: hypothetical protein RSF01_03760 [Bacteroidales bacterium]